MNTEYTREFIELANTLNYTKTALKLHMAQPALSRHISLLEEEVGAQLLFRTKRTVELTDIGRHVYGEFVKIIQSLDSLINEATQMSAGIEGALGIGMLYYALNEYITPVVRDFRKRYPSIKVNLFSCQPFQVLNGLDNDEFDLGMVTLDRWLDPEVYALHLIGKEKLCILTSNSNPLHVKKSISLEELKEQKVLVTPSDSARNQYEALGIDDDKIIDLEKVDQVDSMPLLVEETGGITFVPVI